MFNLVKSVLHLRMCEARRKWASMMKSEDNIKESVGSGGTEIS